MSYRSDKQNAENMKRYKTGDQVVIVNEAGQKFDSKIERVCASRIRLISDYEVKHDGLYLYFSAITGIQKHGRKMKGLRML